MLNRNTYPIQESEFERLINAGAGLKEWSRRFLLISLGAFIVVLAKAIDFLIRYNYIDDRNNVQLEIKNYELIALALSVGLCLLFLIFGLVAKNKKDQLISKIKNHFNSGGNV